jgi:regulator of sigma E protease
MTLFISIVAFIIIFSVLILIHELGHFVMAKRAGIKVEEFGIGMPPKMFKLFKKGDTEYTVNWIPFGGFVRMYGEDNHSLQAETDPQSYQSKSIRQRILVITAGVVMNFVLAIVLLTIGFMFGMEPIMVDLEDVMHNAREGKVMVQEYAVIKKLDSDSVWAQNGFQPEDQIIAINNEQNDIRGEIKALAAEEKEDIQIE